MKVDLVCEGGASKVGGHAGAYAALVNRGFELSHAAGTSSGAIVSALAVAGYTPTELQQLLLETDFTQFLDGSKWKVKRLFDLFINLGMHSGDTFYKWIKQKLLDKGIRTFADIVTPVEEDQQSPKYRWRLKVIASDITNGRLLTFPDDAFLFNIEPDKMEVAFAVRMSMSLPVYFRPVKLPSVSGADNYIIDGGLLSNMPVWIFDSDGIPPWPTLAFLLKEDDFGKPNNTDSLTDYLFSMFKTMLDAHDRRFVRPEDYINRTIAIPTGNISGTRFNLSTVEKQQLYHSGYVSANQFLDNWSWAKYRAWAKKIRGIK